MSRAILDAGVDAPTSTRSSTSASCATHRVRGHPVTISRTGYTGDLGYEIWVRADRAVTLWDALIDGGHALRHHAGRHLGARHRAHRGRPRDARRRLLLGAPRAASRTRSRRRSSSTSDWTVSARQGTVQRPTRAARGAGARLGVALRRHRGRLGLARARSTPSRDCRRSCRRSRGARARRSIARRQAGRLRDERLLVAAAQEVPRARARAGAALRAGHARARSRSRSSIGASSAQRVGAQAAVLRSASGRRRDDGATYDAIVIGGGHNGLVAAAYLARAGKKVARARAAAAASAARR